MHRSRLAAAMLAALIAAAGLTATADPSPAAAVSGGCGSHRSETVPPTTIRVFRTSTGAVDTVDFRAYVKNVVSREWISTWTTESLRAGALAVKNYAWYQVVHWRGYINEAGECFDIFDSTRDQHYDPSRPTYASMSAAVDATWSTLALKGGRIFAAYYNAGTPYEACGANANGWKMYQWGSQACGLAGRSAAQIMTTYYAGITVTAAPPVVTPPPTPTPTPTPTAAPTPPPGATPAPPTPTPTATPRPTELPTPTPAPAPPADTPQPGGGQADIQAPPPAPPADPVPVVVTVEEALASPAPSPTVKVAPQRTDAAALDTHPVARFEALADARERRTTAAASATRTPRATVPHAAALRLLVLASAVEEAIAVLLPDGFPRTGPDGRRPIAGGVRPLTI